MTVFDLLNRMLRSAKTAVGFGLAGAVLVSACTSSETSYPLLDGEREKLFPAGFVGCEWVSHSLKLNPPLTGKLKFDAIDCNKDKRFRPKFGYKKVFSINENNALLINRAPLDPKYPEMLAKGYVYLSVFPHNGKPETVMRKFLNTANREMCGLAKTPSGRWQIGQTKQYFESQDYKFPYFNETCPENLGYMGNENEMACMTDEDFPLANTWSFTCSEKQAADGIFNAFRVSGPVLFAYRQDELESHPDNVRILNPYSVKYIP